MSETDCSEPIRRNNVCDRILRHPFLTILLAGIVIRALFSTLAIVYDLDFWAIVIRNIEAGQGLYGAEGYYYTPVWGYVLSLICAFQDVFLNIGESAIVVDQILFIKDSESYVSYFTYTVPSLIFICSVKIPLFVCDLITALLVRMLVKERLNDPKKTELAFALTFLCPVILTSTGIIAMPDTIMAMFVMLSIVLLKRDMPLLAGACFCIAVLTKFFPIFFIFVLIAYLISKDRESRFTPKSNLAQMVIGASVVALVIFLPQILEGNLIQCFQFLTDRTGFAADDGAVIGAIGLLRVLAYLFVTFASVYLGLKFYRNKHTDYFADMMRYCLILATFSLIYPPTTQYIVFLIPFLAYEISTNNRQFMLSWKILAVGSLIAAFSTNASMFLPLSVWGGIIDLDSIIHVFNLFETPILGPISLRYIQFTVGGVLQCLGILTILLTLYQTPIRELIERYRRKKECGGWDSNP